MNVRLTEEQKRTVLNVHQIRPRRSSQNHAYKVVLKNW